MQVRLWFGAVLGWLMTPILVGNELRAEYFPVTIVALGIVAAACGLLIEVATGDSSRRRVGAIAGCTVAVAIPLFLYPSFVAPSMGVVSASVVALSFFSAFRASRLLREKSSETEIVRPSSTDAEFVEWEIHREIQRARRFDRPLSLVLMTIDDWRPSQTIQDVDFPHSTDVTNLLAGHIKSCDLLVRLDGRFALILPETNRRDAEVATHRLQSLIREQLGCESKYAVAGFPDEERTLTGLWELVLQRLREQRPRRSSDSRSRETPVFDREEPALIRR